MAGAAEATEAATEAGTEAASEIVTGGAAHAAVPRQETEKTYAQRVKEAKEHAAFLKQVPCCLVFTFWP